MNKKIGLLIAVVLVTTLTLIVAPTVQAYTNGDDAHNDSSQRSDNTKGAENERKNRSDLRAIGSTLEVHIADDGKVVVRGAKVTAISGNTISASTVWGLTTLSWTITSDAFTHFLRHSGGQSALSEISVGDFVSFQGQMITTGANLSVTATVIKNWSVQKKNVSFIGKVITFGTNTFLMGTDEHGLITVNVAGAVPVSKDSTTASFATIHIGDKVSVGGVFDEVSKILTASKVKIYADKTAEQHVFEGLLKTIAGITLPASFTLVLNENTTLNVVVPVGVSIVGRTYLGASLADFKTGDKIRVWGLKESSTIDATVVRNVSLPR